MLEVIEKALALIEEVLKKYQGQQIPRNERKTIERIMELVVNSLFNEEYLEEAGEMRNLLRDLIEEKRIISREDLLKIHKIKRRVV